MHAAPRQGDPGRGLPAPVRPILAHDPRLLAPTPRASGSDGDLAYRGSRSLAVPVLWQRIRGGRGALVGSGRPLHGLRAASRPDVPNPGGRDGTVAGPF